MVSTYRRTGAWDKKGTYRFAPLYVLISGIKYHVVAHPLSLVLVRTFSAYIDKIAKQQQSSM